ncbi:hypothetical protein DFS34DRAFT_645034 [Phlyctochytrium arcticum]|nr:hypothetical protein DFS34DRAFT_645034 [Phlyctochytrium arcticum]
MPPKQKSSAPKAKPRQHEGDIAVTTDPRFSRVHSDPRFIKPRKDAAKVTIDSRFSKMLESDEFGTGVKAPKVDKYGRKAQTTASQELKKYYKLEKEEEEEPDKSENSESEDDSEGSKEVGSDEEAASEEDSEDEGPSITRGFQPGLDMARGEGLEESDSEDDDDLEAGLSATEDGPETGPYAEEDVPSGEETHRLAVVNLDWDHVKSKDLFKVFDGFKPPQGLIKSVRVYPSEFGKERLEREAREGPPTEIFSGSKEEEDEDELSKPLIRADDGREEYDDTKLRRYQFERLRYYYAVIECDSVDTARAIYKTCDGAEYEKSANFIDLRYIPDGMTFDDEPRDEAFEAPAVYQPKDFVTQALQHSKVKLTWDEDDDDRIRTTRRKFTKEDLKDIDFKTYIASASEDEDEDTDALRDKYRALLSSGDNGDVYGGKENREEMEITFAPGLSEKAAALLEKRKDKLAHQDDSVFDQYLRKQKEKRKLKKQGGKTEADDEKDDDALVSSDDEGIDMSDPFFAEEFADQNNEEEKPKAQSLPASDKKQAKEEKRKKAAEESKAKAQLELLMMGGADASDARHFDMKQVVKVEKAQKKKGRSRKSKKEQREGGVQEGFEIDVNDSRFTSMLDSHHFAIDPTNPNFKKTLGMEKMLKERRTRRNKKSNTATAETTGPTTVTESAPKSNQISSLVDSIKRKTAAGKTTEQKGKRQRTTK